EGRLRASRRAESAAGAARQAREFAEERSGAASAAALRADQEAQRASTALASFEAAHVRSEWLAGLLEQTHDGIFVWALDSGITYWNRGAELMYGWSRVEVTGTRPAELLLSVPFGDMASIAAVHRQLRDLGAWAGELKQYTRDGRELIVASRMVVLGAATGPRLVLETNRDVTDRKRIESQLEHAQRIDAIGQLAGGVAHDFNNLLTAINGYATFLRESLPEGDPRRADVFGIMEASESAAALTQQLLAFGRKQVMQPEVLDVGDTLESTARMLRRLIGEDIELALILNPSLSAVVADRAQVGQILINLALNARDAMPRGGRLTIEARDVPLNDEYAETHLAVAVGSYVLIAVSDTGQGMTPEVKSRIFEPFFTTKPRGKGTGLGLSTVFGIVKQSGGHIFVYSEPGHGTTFKIYLPKAEEAAAPAAGADVMPVAMGTETILVAEDDAMIRAIAHRVLAMQAYTVLDAGNPREVIELAAQHNGPIDLLITDVVLPEMGGRELADRLLRDRAEMAVLYMSGYTDNAIVHHGRLDPDTEFLAKPFTPATLLRRVREVLDRRDSHGARANAV
ncbi:MAG TPA: ATP-binding protein, partial [Gemmatimonadaceae bacterium]|nr:ATP-binding protein [Gemmatimonadaceae bacterium]